LSAFLQQIAERAQAESDAKQRRLDRAQAILDAQNGPAREFMLDPLPYRAVRCPRRAGKSFALGSLAVRTGELIPGARILIISLTLKSTRDNYWTGPGSLAVMSARFDLGLKFNNTYLEWAHENGSTGRLAGAETLADIEKIRGALAEADLAILDEGKSFSPGLMEALYLDVLEPGLMTRDGRLVFAGTPGSIPMGRFFQATSPSARISGENGEDFGPSAIPWELRESEQVAYVSHVTCCSWQDRDCTKGTPVPYRDLPKEDLWSLHSWTIKDNRKFCPEDPERQWRRALSTKRRNGWADDHPTWRREYLGQWVSDQSDLCFAYGTAKACKKDVTWHPRPTRENRTGLPPELGPWHLVMGLDFGHEDDFAIVLAGWSEQTQELRHVYDWKSPHLLIDGQLAEIRRVIDTYGQPEVIVGDAGAQGKSWVLELNQRGSLGIIPAEKREKEDFRELMNGDFHAARIKVIPDTDLEHELLGLQWDLSKDSKERLARLGRLREDPSCPNHLCDAFLYLWRYSYHYWATSPASGPEQGTPEWHVAEQERAVAAVLARRASAARDPHGLSRLTSEEPLTAENLLWR
jgi:hypothetical protein